MYLFISVVKTLTMCPETLHLIRYFGAERRTEDVYQNL